MREDLPFLTPGFGALAAVVALGPILAIRPIGGGLTEGIVLSMTLLPILLAARWVFVDARRIQKNAWVWAMAVVVLNLLGLVVYALARTSGDRSAERT